MDANELLREWPDWAKANAARVLASPAWRLETRFGGEPARLTRCANLSAPSVVLDVRLDDEPHMLTLGISPLFPDLTLLAGNLPDLPKEVLLALAEKECGPVFQLVEDVFKRQLSIVGLSDAAIEAASASCVAFAVDGAAGGATFALDLTPEMAQRLGSLANLDATHATIRSLTRPAFACHAVLALTEEERAALSVGDCLVPEAGQTPQWLLDLPTDDQVRVLADEAGTLTFAQLADDALPPVPPAATLTLRHRGQALAHVEPTRLGTAFAFRVVTL